MTSISEIADIVAGVLSGVESVEYAFLFGSFTRRLLPESDIDILVGGDLECGDKFDLVAVLSTRLKRPVDLVSVREASCDVVLKAMSEGRLLFAKHPEILKRDYFRNYIAYDNNTALRRIRLDRIRREYGYGR